MTDDKEELILSVAFDLRVDVDEYKALVTATGRDYQTWKDGLEENLREDLERALPAEDWKPFKRTPFYINAESFLIENADTTDD